MDAWMDGGWTDRPTDMDRQNLKNAVYDICQFYNSFKKKKAKVCQAIQLE